MRTWLPIIVIIKILLIAGYIETSADVTGASFDHKWHELNDLSLSPWNPDPEYMYIRYFSKDIRIKESQTEISFDCEVSKKIMKPTLNWYNSKSEFTFNSEPVSVDVYVDRNFIYKLPGKNLGVYEGMIYVNADELKKLFQYILPGSVLELFIYNEARKIEEHVIISVKHFNPESMVFICFKNAALL